MVEIILAEKTLPLAIPASTDEGVALLWTEEVRNHHHWIAQLFSPRAPVRGGHCEGAREAWHALQSRNVKKPLARLHGGAHSSPGHRAEQH
eukprot:scaffold922_cov327-Pinguiococcus_pyrenoidosus.AAC.41